jgi:hypothetical protein
MDVGDGYILNVCLQGQRKISLKGSSLYFSHVYSYKRKSAKENRGHDVDEL